MYCITNVPETQKDTKADNGPRESYLKHQIPWALNNDNNPVSVRQIMTVLFDECKRWMRWGMKMSKIKKLIKIQFNHINHGSSRNDYLSLKKYQVFLDYCIPI